MVSLHNGRLLRFSPQVYKVLLPHWRHGLYLLLGAFSCNLRRTSSVSLVLFFDLCFFSPFHVKTTPMLSGKLEVLIRGGERYPVNDVIAPPLPLPASGPQQLVFETSGVYSRVGL